jgi:hypothetical protein
MEQINLMTSTKEEEEEEEEERAPPHKAVLEVPLETISTTLQHFVDLLLSTK